MRFHLSIWRLSLPSCIMLPTRSLIPRRENWYISQTKILLTQWSKQTNKYSGFGHKNPLKISINILKCWPQMLNTAVFRMTGDLQCRLNGFKRRCFCTSVEEMSAHKSGSMTFHPSFLTNPGYKIRDGLL